MGWRRGREGGSEKNREMVKEGWLKKSEKG